MCCLAEDGDGRVDLEEPQHQHVWAVVLGEGEQVGDLALQPRVRQVEQRLYQV